MSRNQGPRPSSDTLLQEWKDHLVLLNDDLTGLEQANACIEIVLRSLSEKHSRFLFQFVAQLFGQWAAIGARRVYKKGNQKYPNVALERLMNGIIERPDVVLEHGDQRFIGPWIGLDHDAGVTPAEISQAAKRDLDHLKGKMTLVADYANTIAHLQLVGEDLSGELKIKGRDVSAALEELRRKLKVYYNLLTGGFPPDLGGDRFVASLEEEVDRLLP